MPQGDKNAASLQGLSVLGAPPAVLIFPRLPSPVNECTSHFPADKPPPRRALHPAPGPAGTSQIDRIVEAVEETLRGNTVHLLQKKALPRLNLPKVRGSPSSHLHGPPRARAAHLRSAPGVRPRSPSPQIRRNPHIEIIPLSTGEQNKSPAPASLTRRPRFAAASPNPPMPTPTPLPPCLSPPPSTRRLPRRVHLLQDEARPRRARVLRPRGHRRARPRGGPRGGFRSLVQQRGHGGVRARPRDEPLGAAAAGRRGAPPGLPDDAPPGHDQPPVHPPAARRAQRRAEPPGGVRRPPPPGAERQQRGPQECARAAASRRVFARQPPNSPLLTLPPRRSASLSDLGQT